MSKTNEKSCAVSVYTSCLLGTQTPWDIESHAFPGEKFLPSVEVFQSLSAFATWEFSQYSLLLNLSEGTVNEGFIVQPRKRWPPLAVSAQSWKTKQ